LSDPSTGGGIRNIAEMINNYLEGEKKDLNVLMDYIGKSGNKTVYKRLGYILEYLKYSENDYIERCRNKISSGYAKLDPLLPARGKLSRRWMLRINALL
jgi:predicted transcriptional regulator of viral defense system